MLGSLGVAWKEIKRDLWYFVQRVILRRKYLPAPARAVVTVDLRK